MSDDPIIEGMAEIAWAIAWADHVEEVQCCSLSGVEITQAMPEIGEVAYRWAERTAGAIEQANDRNLPALLYRAAVADGRSEIVDYSQRGPNAERRYREYAERFGNCLAYMAMGHGVSWFDDHAEFDLKVPHREASIDVQIEAAQACSCGGEED